MPIVAETKLADGTLAASATALYTAPTDAKDERVNVTKMILYNTSATTQTVILYYTPSGGSDAEFRKLTLALDESAVLDESDLPLLEEGDAVKAETTTASVVNYILAGEF